MSNKIAIGLGLVFALIFIGIGYVFVQQRQATVPRADTSLVGDVCARVGGIAPGQSGQCLPGYIPVPAPTDSGGPQSLPSGQVGGQTGSQIGGSQGNLQLDDGATGNPTLPSRTPSGATIGICCIPVITPSGFVTNVPSEPVPSVPVPSDPVPTGCPLVGDAIPQSDCSQSPRCDFSVQTDPGTGTVSVRSLFASGSYNFDSSGQLAGDGGTAATSDSNLRQEKSFVYTKPGTYNIRFSCQDSTGQDAGTCTQTIRIAEGACTTPTVPVPSVTTGPTGTPPACILPVPVLEFECPRGCVTPQ